MMNIEDLQKAFELARDRKKTQQLMMHPLTAEKLLACLFDVKQCSLSTLCPPGQVYGIYDDDSLMHLWLDEWMTPEDRRQPMEIREANP